ncbi:hypothetical protein JMJ35_002061 [Cladonia borealis]|uniref:Uncharacterized protein n=1 Tax=Cladonia borealis TaxID=184061 RepID=A0AA39V4S3_9LECA|nr:hypothetical protein JMJ35_002061 [Cladonia borealis]
MYIHQILLAMSRLLSLTFAQQRCYWPNGSSITPTQEPYVNCRSDEDSSCCFQGDVCLSNGLCFGSGAGWFCNDIAPGAWANIWNCPGINSGPRFNWCGDTNKVDACQSEANISNTQSSFPTFTTVSILGFPPLTLTSSSPIASPATIQNSITVATQVALVSGTTMTQFSTMAASTMASRPSQHPDQETKQASAIGAGIGVPLGVAAIGFLGLLFWRETKRRSMNKHQILSAGNGNAQGGWPFANQATQKRGAELLDTQTPWELDHRTGIVEMPTSSSSRS